MTTHEAKEIYLNSDCSYFLMCTNDYSGYIEYRQLGLQKAQEEVWKNEKLQMLSMEIKRTGDYRLFRRMYEIAKEFHDHEKFNTADGTGHAGHDPKQRNQSGIPQRDADGLSQEEAGINRAANAQRSKNSVEPIGLSHVLPVFTLENDLGADHGIEHGTDAQQRKQTNADEHPRLEIKGKVR